ncbi:hypothetical protein P389DRAFT_2791 [Cystobasidium minutum MCA 4210]|uniref:uncharacterized protein n=1 Tax=Cystobasidium minutum MCA 4210 TaxID=1397322 RepID=UPI0034D00D4D|eukprot:jgi/Rhomi1/2791/CE2790_24685
MVKRTRAASIVSSSPSTSIPSTSSNPDNEYIEQEDLRPATRRRTNNTRSKVTEATTSSSSASHSTEVESPSTAQDPKAARKQQRKERNRISAQHSRDRKKFESQELRGRLEEAETRVSALAADNERLREENTRFKLELEKSSSLQGELSSLKERFEMLERLLLSGNQSQSTALPSAATSLSTPTTLSNSSQSSISAPVQADSRIGSETHATGMHSLFRSTTSTDSRSGMTGLGRASDSQQDMNSSGRSLQGSTMSSLPPSLTTARLMTSSRPTASASVLQPLQRPSPALQNRKTPSTRHSKSFSPLQAASYLPTSRLSLQDKQRFLQRRQLRQQALHSHQAQLRADQLARAKFITMTMIDSMSNSRRS